MSESLADALLSEQKRVRELIPIYQPIGPAGGFAIAMMNRALEDAERAVMDGDVVQMIASLEDLRGYKA
jgi:molybdopterin converting factor small subunit